MAKVENLLWITAACFQPTRWVFNICLDVRNFADPQLIAWERLLNRVERTMLEQERTELPLRRDLSASAAQSLSKDTAEAIERRLSIYRARAFMIADEGRENEITKALRRMHVFNPIPSRFGAWPTGTPTRNLTTDRIIEDPIFKRSDRSYFIQLADCVAYALLKREVPPTPRVSKYGIDQMFDQAIARVCFKKASPRDPLGIVR